VRLAKVDVVEVLEQAIAAWDPASARVTLHTDLGTDAPPIDGDAEQLKRVLINLLENAAEAFSPEQADREVRVSARYDTARDIVVVEVSDNGPGIEPANLQKLFQPYFSTKGRGTGLGLAIVQRIIADHKGRIHAAQNQPRGAKFIIELPTAS